jgi:uncharacterized membrane protein YdbT with pleckstrin-like domain
MAPFTIVAAIMTFAWPFATSKGALIAIAVIYGCVDYAAVVVNVDADRLLRQFFVWDLRLSPRCARHVHGCR